jgi:hypothetical protein
MERLETLKEIAESRKTPVAALRREFPFYERLRYLCEMGNNPKIERIMSENNIYKYF